MYKIVGADGQQYGPVSADQVRRWMAEGRAKGETLIQAEGSSEWKPLNTFPEFAELRATAPPVNLPGSAANQNISARASQKVAAGVCGILLGEFGVHKFILGYTVSGLVMLLVTVVGGLLTCGISSAVMWVIGIIEGIIYLTKSDEEFVRTYVDSRKEWF